MIEVLKYTIPALVVMATAWVVLYKLLREEKDRRDFELRKDTRKEITPIRLRGYERLALLLERTQPEHILRDINLTDMTVQELQVTLIKTIRMEFDHNLSQQIYVSDFTWESILQVQEEMIRFINTGAATFPANAPALPFAQQLITVYQTNGETPSQLAQKRLRTEARDLLA